MHSLRVSGAVSAAVSAAVYAAVEAGATSLEPIEHAMRLVQLAHRRKQVDPRVAG